MTRPGTEAGSSSGRVLVVDDLEVNRQLLSRRATHAGYHVEEAASGEEALTRLGEGTYDVVLLDVMMPGMSGYEVLERIKEDPSLTGIRVIMVSAVEDVESVVRCIALGADDYLPKPFNPVLLEARLASSLARKRLQDAERAHAQALERELEVGREIQAGFFPTSLPDPPGWSMASHFESAKQVAGDFYDAFELADGTLGLLLGDVCDKGVGAALYMALFRSLLRSRAMEVGGPADEVLMQTLRYANEYIADTHSDANMFATVFFAVVDLGSGALHYANAGHDPPALVRSVGSTEPLERTGPALGLMPGATFTVGARTLDHGDGVLAYTDGVTEAASPDGEFFGEDRVLRKLRGGPAPPTKVILGLAAEVAHHRAGQPPSDDVTMLCIARL